MDLHSVYASGRKSIYQDGRELNRNRLVGGGHMAVTPPQGPLLSAGGAVAIPQLFKVC